MLNAFFLSSTVGFGILDSELRYRRINSELANMSGRRAEDFIGKTPCEVFGDYARDGEAALRQVMSSGEPLLGRERSGEFSTTPGERRHWLVNYFPIRDEQHQVTQLGVIALDVTARRNAEEAIRRLSGRLINIQDEERRRIAREIHDSLGQYLAGLKITIDLMGMPGTENKKELLAESSQILEQCISETRTLSHLLHPPLLDEAGFASAARWFVNGFSQRSGIPIAIEMPEDFPRLPKSVEIALFRVVQESLTNVHRHSGSATASIRLIPQQDQVTLEVRDYGKGIPSFTLQQFRQDGTQTGVGLAGMRERIHELGGSFEIESDANGTCLEVSIPLKQGASASL